MSSRKKYVVRIEETVVHEIPVRAKDEEQADRKAAEIFANEGGEPYYFSSDWYITLTRKVKVSK
ncbi:hypothetical protein ACFVYF_18940 [Streptomyces sp. NPDC058274]|uniref:hypothetical protein n=1 Tax=Streptomyces sp. NPDC058274 TaxID=3346416 RepID=UPI0036E73CF7